jgi:hypothetical protein
MPLGGHSDGLVIRILRIGFVYTSSLVPRTLCARVILIALDLAATAFPTGESGSSTTTLLWLPLRLSLHEVTGFNLSFLVASTFGRTM